MKLLNLSKQLEEKWGVQQPHHVRCCRSTSIRRAAAPAEEEKSEFTVFLSSIGDKKINVIKEVRAFNRIGIKEAKDLVEAAPKEVKSGVPKKDAEEAKKKLRNWLGLK